MIARGRYAQAETLLRPVASRAPSSEAALELGLLQQMLGRPDADGAARKGRAARRNERRSGRGRARRRARCARSAASTKPTPPTALATRGAPNDAAIQTAFGDLFLEKYDKAEALKSYQMALQVDPKWIAGAGRRGASAV